MTREILFRGKRVDNSEWVEGYYVQWKCWHDEDSTWTTHHGIVSTTWCNCKPRDCYEVDPLTVGQFTGLVDEKDVKVFEDDIIQVATADKRYRCQKVVFKDGVFCGYSELKTCKWTSLDVIKRSNVCFQVVGSVHGDVINQKDPQ